MEKARRTSRITNWLSPRSSARNWARDNAFSYRDGEPRETLREGQDFVPFTFSTNGKFHGQVVFAGYGITAKEHNYDDYAGIDVKDKLVLILRHEPQETRRKERV